MLCIYWNFAIYKVSIIVFSLEVAYVHCVLLVFAFTLFSDADLIYQHYAHYVHEYLVQQQLIGEWKSFFALPEEDQDWETGTTNMY